MNNPIFEVQQEQLVIAAEVIRASFATVANLFGLTQQNCPVHSSFTTTKVKELGGNIITIRII